MNGPFYPVEHAILCDYFRIKRPAALRDLEIVDYDEEPRGPDDPILVVEASEYYWQEFAVPNAVARLLLSRVQRNLPQWASYKDGVPTWARKHWPARGGAVQVLPRRLLEINWADSGPGFSWPEAYHATFLPGYERWVVTASADTDEVYGYEDIAIGHFRSGVPVRDGSRKLIKRWWRRRKREDQQAAWVDVWAKGLISEDEALDWRDAVWFPWRRKSADIDRIVDRVTRQLFPGLPQGGK